MAETNWRELCRKLVQHAANAQLVLVGEGLWDGDEDDGLLEHARAALAEPEPEDDVALLREALAATAAQRRAEDDARAALAADGPAVPEGRQPAPPAAGEAVGPEWRPCVKLPITVHVREQRPDETRVSARGWITSVRPDDLIMRGVHGEEYPIGRELFEKTYRLGPAEPAPPVAGAPCPSMEDVGPLIAWLAEQACQAADASQPTDAGMLTWAAQVIGERVNEDAPVPPAAGEVGTIETIRAALARINDILNDSGRVLLADTREALELARRALEQRHLAPAPIAERSWEREGWCDEQGWCWFCNSYSMGQWSYSLPPSPGQGWGRLGTMTHSLPHWAIPRPRPLPQQETTNG